MATLNYAKTAVNNPQVQTFIATAGAKSAQTLGLGFKALRTGILGVAVAALISPPLSLPTVTSSNGKTIGYQDLPEGYNIGWDDSKTSNPTHIKFPSGNSYHGEDIIIGDDGVPIVINVPGMGGDDYQAGSTASNRKRGVSRMWQSEIERIRNGNPSRNWTAEQEADILSGKVPKSAVDGKPIEGAHIQSVKDAPEKADDPVNIIPKSFTEHRKKDSGEHSSNPQDLVINETTTP